MKYFIGLDAHSSTSTFAVLNEIGECVLRKTVDTSEKNLWHVLESINGERILTLEESTISQWLYLILREKVDRLLVCNPTFVAKKPGAKTDFRDAIHLANELRCGHLMGSRQMKIASTKTKSDVQNLKTIQLDLFQRIYFIK